VIPVNSRRRRQDASPLFLVISVAFLIGIIILVWRNSETFQRISRAISGETTKPASDGNSAEKQEPSDTPPPQKAAKPVRTLQKPLPVPAAAPIQPDPRPDEAQVVAEDPSQASVKTDSTAAYSSNSSRSPVVYVLKKGDTVETRLELVDSAGRWTLVRMRDSNRSVFVRSENLEHSASPKAVTTK